MATRVRLDLEARAYGEDIKWWAIGIAITFFASISAVRFARHHRPFCTTRILLVRFWLGSGALGGVGFGTSLCVLVIVAARDGVQVLDSTKATVALIAMGLLMLSYGIALGARATRPRSAVRAWIDDGAKMPLT